MVDGILNSICKGKTIDCDKKSMDGVSEGVFEDFNEDEV